MAPVCLAILVMSVGLTYCISTMFALNSNSCAFLQTDLPTMRTSGLSLKIFVTIISMYLSSCSRSVSKDAILPFSVRVYSIPPDSIIMRAPPGITRAIRLCDTFLWKTTPDMYAESSTTPPGITFTLQYGRMSRRSPFLTSGSTVAQHRVARVMRVSTQRSTSEDSTGGGFEDPVVSATEETAADATLISSRRSGASARSSSLPSFSR